VQLGSLVRQTTTKILKFEGIATFDAEYVTNSNELSMLVGGDSSGLLCVWDLHAWYFSPSLQPTLL
jgi:hypothetical protein